MPEPKTAAGAGPPPWPPAQRERPAGTTDRLGGDTTRLSPAAHRAVYGLDGPPTRHPHRPAAAREPLPSPKPHPDGRLPASHARRAQPRPWLAVAVFWTAMLVLAATATWNAWTAFRQGDITAVYLWEAAALLPVAAGIVFTRWTRRN